MDHLIDTTLGAALLGGLAASILYGITSIQTAIYFQEPHGDRRSFKSMIFFLWFLDTLQLAFVIHALYYYLITSYGNIVALMKPTWSILLQIYVTSLTDFIVRSVFAGRVWLLRSSSGRDSKNSALLPLLIVVISFTVFMTGIGFATKGFMLQSFIRLNEAAKLWYCSLGSAVIADILIAVSLCVLLLKRRTGFQQTDSIVKILVVFTVNTGILTSIGAIACFITYFLWPDNFIFMGIYFTLGKLYINSLLATLNARGPFRRDNGGVNIVTGSPTIVNTTPLNCFPLKGTDTNSDPGAASSSHCEDTDQKLGGATDALERGVAQRGILGESRSLNRSLSMEAPPRPGKVVIIAPDKRRRSTLDQPPLPQPKVVYPAKLPDFDVENWYDM